MDIGERFEAVYEDFLKFDRVENKRSQRPDIHAYLLLDELFPRPGYSMIISASNDEIWLDVQGRKLEGLTEEQILELSRCGVRYDDMTDYLVMYV